MVLLSILSWIKDRQGYVFASPHLLSSSSFRIRFVTVFLCTVLLLLLPRVKMMNEQARFIA